MIARKKCKSKAVTTRQSFIKKTKNAQKKQKMFIFYQFLNSSFIKKKAGCYKRDIIFAKEKNDAYPAIKS